MSKMTEGSGIQQLLVAEKSASEKVGEARKRKARRLKQAKDEAKAEIEKYKQDREQKYKEHESKIMGSKGEEEGKINLQTDLLLEEMNKKVELHREEALQRMLSLVMDVQTVLHRNFKLQQS